MCERRKKNIKYIYQHGEAGPFTTLYKDLHNLARCKKKGLKLSNCVTIKK